MMFRDLKGCGLALAAGLILVGAPGLAFADPVTAFDTTLPAPGFVNGSGNQGVAFFNTATLDNGVVIGLGVQPLFANMTIPSYDPTSNTYFVQAGGTPTRATWNIDFALNLNGNPSIGPALITVLDQTTGKQ